MSCASDEPSCNKLLSLKYVNTSLFPLSFILSHRGRGERSFMNYYRSLYQATLLLTVLFAVPSEFYGRPPHGKFGYAVMSVHYYRLPETIQKKSPDGSPLPSTDHRLGRIRVGSQLEILERRPGWLRIRDTEKETQEGWVKDDSGLSFTDPRLYFRMQLGNRALIGYCVFNANSGLSEGHIRKVRLTDGGLASRVADLSTCTSLTFAGRRISYRIKGGGVRGESLGGDLADGNCYLISDIRIRLNQLGREFVLERIR
jgi:hypothetical protein